MSKIINSIFWLAVLLIVVVYFKGFSTDAGTVGGTLNTLMRTLTGQGDNGFNAYPTGA